MDKYLEFILSQKGKDVEVYNTHDEATPSDFVIVQHFSSNLDNKKFAEAFMEKFSLDTFPEGYNRGEWIIFDLGEVIIHSFVQDKRVKYNLDKLWQNKRISFKEEKKTKKRG